MEPEPRALTDRDDGVAVLLVMLMLLVLTGLAFAALSLADLEAAASANDGQERVVAYAAEGAMERAIHDLSTMADWTGVVSGAVTSSLRDSDPQPVSRWGAAIDVAGMTADAQREASAGAGPDRTRWCVFLSGSFAAMLPDNPPEVLPYAVAWVGDDNADGDGNPLVDTNRVVRLRVRALGPRGVRVDREAVVERVAASGVVRVRARWAPG